MGWGRTLETRAIGKQKGTVFKDAISTLSPTENPRGGKTSAALRDGRIVGQNLVRSQGGAPQHDRTTTVIGEFFSHSITFFLLLLSTAVNVCPTRPGPDTHRASHHAVSSVTFWPEVASRGRLQLALNRCMLERFSQPLSACADEGQHLETSFYPRSTSLSHPVYPIETVYAWIHSHDAALAFWTSLF